MGYSAGRSGSAAAALAARERMSGHDRSFSHPHKEDERGRGHTAHISGLQPDHSASCISPMDCCNAFSFKIV